MFQTAINYIHYILCFSREISSSPCNGSLVFTAWSPITSFCSLLNDRKRFTLVRVTFYNIFISVSLRGAMVLKKIRSPILHFLCTKNFLHFEWEFGVHQEYRNCSYVSNCYPGIYYSFYSFKMLTLPVWIWVLYGDLFPGHMHSLPKSRNPRLREGFSPLEDWEMIWPNFGHPSNTGYCSKH